MNILRHSRLVKTVSCVGTVYKILACDRDIYILFIPDTQRVTRVGTLCAPLQVLLGMVLRSDNNNKEIKKMKMKNITKWLGASVVFGLLSLATQGAHATNYGPLAMSYTTNSPYLIGTVIPGTLGSGQAVRDAAMTNTLLGMSFGAQSGTGTVADPLYSRTTLPGSGPATTVGNVALTGYSGGTGNVTIDLSQYGTFQYLVAAYDGRNAGVAVFDISSLTANDSVTVWGFAKPETVGGVLTGNLLGSDHAQQGYFRLTSITLLNPTGGVPDGGATVMLLGAALSTLGVARRFFLKS